MLGELGWQGLATWLALLAAAILGALAAWRRRGDRLGLALAAQLAALTAASATDYYVEVPYNKLQLFALLAVAAAVSARGRWATAQDSETTAPPKPGGVRDQVAKRRPPSSPANSQDQQATEAARRKPPPPAGTRGATGTKQPAEPPLPQPAPAIGALAVSLLATTAIGWAACNLVKSHAAAALEEVYTAGVEAPLAAGEPVALTALLALEQHGQHFERLPGHSKSQFRDPLLLAHGSLLRGDRRQAATRAARSLHLHPYYPNAFRLLARIVEPANPRLAERYRVTYRYLMDEAQAGFQRPYPPLPPMTP
jgi:hypothetical protein